MHEGPKVAQFLACVGNREKSWDLAQSVTGVLRLERWLGATAHGGA